MCEVKLGSLFEIIVFILSVILLFWYSILYIL